MFCPGNAEAVKLWLGFSPKTGWPVKYVVRSRNLDASIELTKLDANPDFRGVFKLPIAVIFELAPGVMPGPMFENEDNQD